MKPPFPPKPKCKKCGVEIWHTAKNGLCAKHAREAGIKTGPTREQRSKFKLCGARKSDGLKCRLYAGQGTNHVGVGRCKLHGGNTPGANEAAIIEQAKVEMVKLGAPVNVKPIQALIGLLRMTAGHVAFLHTEVGAIEDVSEPESRVLIELYDGERDRLAKVAQACVGAGIAERLVRVEETKITALGQAMKRAAEVAGLDEHQQRKLGAALRMELSQLPTDGSDDEDIWGPSEDGGLKVIDAKGAA